MTNYRDPKLWQGFLRINGFPPHVPQPTEKDIAALQKESPEQTKEELLKIFADQETCPDLD